MKQTRNTLKSYFETGDRPTEGQFEELIHSYAHLNEFNFGLSVKPSGETSRQYCHFYRATNVRDSGQGHKTVLAGFGSSAPTYSGYNHLFSREVWYKTLLVNLVGEVDVNLHQPKIIVERYRQTKKYPSGYIRPAGFYQENSNDASIWGRQSEYDVTHSTMNIDITPIQYFRPNLYSSAYKDFIPSGAYGEGRRKRSFKFTTNAKPFVPLRLKLQITIDNVDYVSQPVDLKIVLGTTDIYDAINFVFH